MQAFDVLPSTTSPFLKGDTEFNLLPWLLPDTTAQESLNEHVFSPADLRDETSGTVAYSSYERGDTARHSVPESTSWSDDLFSSAFEPTGGRGRGGRLYEPRVSHNDLGFGDGIGLQQFRRSSYEEKYETECQKGEEHEQEEQDTRACDTYNNTSEITCRQGGGRRDYSFHSDTSRSSESSTREHRPSTDQVGGSTSTSTTYESIVSETEGCDILGRAQRKTAHVVTYIPRSRWYVCGHYRYTVIYLEITDYGWPKLHEVLDTCGNACRSVLVQERWSNCYATRRGNPRAHTAALLLWRTYEQFRPEGGWRLDTNELRRYLQIDTRAVCIVEDITRSMDSVQKRFKDFRWGSSSNEGNRYRFTPRRGGGQANLVDTFYLKRDPDVDTNSSSIQAQEHRLGKRTQSSQEGQEGETGVTGEGSGGDTQAGVGPKRQRRRQRCRTTEIGSVDTRGDGTNGRCSGGDTSVQETSEPRDEAKEGTPKSEGEGKRRARSPKDEGEASSSISRSSNSSNQYYQVASQECASQSSDRRRSENHAGRQALPSRRISVGSSELFRRGDQIRRPALLFTSYTIGAFLTDVCG